MTRNTAFLNLLNIIRAWLIDAYTQCAEDYGRVLRVHDHGANVARCSSRDCEHERYEREHDVTWLTSVDVLGPCDRFASGPWIELVYECDCRYVGGGMVTPDDDAWSIDEDPNAHGGRVHSHHAVYGATSEGRAACWAS